LGAACHNPFANDKNSADMIWFKQIDNKLNLIAKRLGTTVATSVGGHGFDGIEVPKDKLMIRQILWVDGSIGKGIIIDQNFENRNIDKPDWDFINIAWLQDGESNSKGRPFLKKDLLKKVKFEKIESSIDKLLKESLENLAAVKKSDLGYN
jgi:hypothetical protein